MSGTQSSNAGQAVTPGNWITQTINGMTYQVLLPANYDPSIKYPTVLYLHQLDMGDDPSGLLAEVNPWFNSTTFRADYPAIIVMPLLDQTADPSGETINWGGVSTADSAGEDNAIAALQQVQQQYSTDNSRIYVTGNSMGGIGTEDMVIKYNAYTGTEGKIFAAALSLAGADYGQGYPTPNASVVGGLKNVPFWAIHGGQDTTVPLTWDQNLYAAEQASGGDMMYTQDNSLGHDVWDTYYTQDGPGSPLGWLFSQSTNGNTTPPSPPSATPSANDTTVAAGSTAAITDASGNLWTITSAGLVAVNGTADTTTANVIELAYVNGTVWQENASKLWWGKTSPTATWTAGANPLPAPSANDTTVAAGSTAAITDASGNLWTITSAGLVAVNGTADTTTANVIELAYVNGTVWQENASKLWWSKTSPTATWTAGANPLPAPSANDTTVAAGSTAAITDASGNLWTITSAGLVAVNGTADTTTANVIELAYVNGTVWQENASKLWWSKTSPTATWTAGADPLPVTPTPPPTPANVVGSGSDMIVLTMSEDADGPAGVAGRDAEFTVNVDGRQIGGLQTVTASHAAGQTETFTFEGNYAPGRHAVTVTFANNSMTAGDQAAFNDGGDRNLYVNSVTYDHSTVSSSVTPVYGSPFYPPLSASGLQPGNAVYSVTDTTAIPANPPSTATTTPAAASFGTGPDTLTLAMSEDPYAGDAMFTVAVDGTAIPATFTTSAIEWEGQAQQFNLHGTWGNGAHTVTVTYLNDLVGPIDSAGGYDPDDRNLVINGVSYDGTSATGAPYELFNDGSASFSVPVSKPATPTPTPAPTPLPPASANDTMVLAGSSGTITDAAGNSWGITSSGQVVVDGVVDATTANVTELAYVGHTVWQENASNLWWGKANASAAWGTGSSTSPLPAPITLVAASTTVSQSDVSIASTSGGHMLFLSGSGDVANLSGGANTITDTGSDNTYILPASGAGADTFTSNIFNAGDKLDIAAALGATDWAGSAYTYELPNYLKVSTSGQNVTLSMADKSGSAGVAIATINGAGATTLTSLLPHLVI